ncbi:hypothetical protein Tco_1344930 [Tanacetum coccineum]
MCVKKAPDEAAQYGGNPKSLTFEIHHGGCFTPTSSSFYVGGKVSSVDVVNIDEPRLGLEYGLHPLNVDVDVFEMTKYVKDNKIILVYVEHESSNVDSSIFVTPKKGVAIAVDNHLRKAPIKINSIPDVNRNLTPVCHKSGIRRTNSVDPFDGLDEILSDYANTRAEITGKQMIVHVDVDNETEEESDIEENNTSGSDSQDLDYDPKHDEVFDDDDEHILEDVHEHDLDVIDYDSFGSELDDGIDSERRTQLRELRRIGKIKNRKQFDVGVLNMQAFRAKRITSDKMVGSFKEHYSLLREYAEELINQNPRTTIRIDVQQEPNPDSPTRTFRRCPWPARATTVVEFNKKMGQLKSYNFAAYDWLMKIRAEQQLVDGRDQPIISCLEYIREYLMKRTVVVQKVIAKTVRLLTPFVTALFDAIKKVATDYIVQWNGGHLYQVTRPCRDQRVHDDEDCNSSESDRKDCWTTYFFCDSPL